MTPVSTCHYFQAWLLPQNVSEKHRAIVYAFANSLFLSKEQPKMERTPLWLSLSRVSKELSRKQLPKGSLHSVNANWGMVWWEGFSWGRLAQVFGDSTEVLWLRFEIGSKLKESRAVYNDRMWGCGQEAEMGIIKGILAKPATVLISIAAVFFKPEPRQKNGALENRRA